MTGVRTGLATAGVAAGLFGLVLLLTGSTTDLVSIAIWFAGCIVVHDAVLAPLFVAGGMAARRALPHHTRPPVVAGAICTLTLVVIASPVLFRSNALSDNPTILDRNYPAGFAVSLAVVWAAVAVSVVLRRSRRPLASPAA
ncbi:hypothetical protein RHODO2019_17215 [Rhodococcus antarcticus]|uniref:Lipoprotein n=1 Tax=Rhodococcus antarcticus TaxID=2987751 RepID=A0ABY6P0Z2_9NOCA|nr:hypothetical protein [Rhodococcus antarcticus]UZJ24818.1 hypothetical protein RHODO2019_17215 [Rhodococcus antarcticus]